MWNNIVNETWNNTQNKITDSTWTKMSNKMWNNVHVGQRLLINNITISKYV